MTRACPCCGDEFQVPSLGAGTFTTISVSYHDDDRADWAESYCPACADEILADAVPDIIRGVDPTEFGRGRDLDAEP